MESTNEKLDFQQSTGPAYSQVVALNANITKADTTIVPQRKHSWDRKKRRAILAGVIVAAVVLTVIFGSILGARATEGDEVLLSLRSRDYLHNAITGTTTPTPLYPYPTSTATPGGGHGGNVTISPRRDLGIGHGGPIGGPDSLIVWQLNNRRALSWKEPGSTSTSNSEWHAAASSPRSFAVAPTAVAIAGGDNEERIALALDRRGGVLYARYRDGVWEDRWKGLGGLTRPAAARPAAVSVVEGRVDVFVVDAAGRVYHGVLDGAEWGGWAEIGSGFVGEIAVTGWEGDGRIDVFGRTATGGGKGIVKHRVWSSNGDGDWQGGWEDLGSPSQSSWVGPFGSPLAVVFADDAGDMAIDLVQVVENMGTHHKLYSGGQWGEWRLLSASHEGYEFANTQALIGRPGGAGSKPEDDTSLPAAHLFSRGTDNCIHYNSFNGTDWTFWNYLWCYDTQGVNTWQTQYLSLAAGFNSGNGAIDLVAETVAGELLYVTLGVPVDEDSRFGEVPWVNIGAAPA